MAKIKNKQILVDSNFDINSKKLINVAAGVDSNDAVNKSQLDAIITSIPSSSNKEMTANATTADFQAATATTIAASPSGDGYVAVLVNGLQQILGNGVKTKDCYFSADGGTTAKSIANIASGDTLYWVGSVAGYELAITDKIDFNYNVIV